MCKYEEFAPCMSLVTAQFSSSPKEQRMNYYFNHWLSEYDASINEKYQRINNIDIGK